MPVKELERKRDVLALSEAFCIVSSIIDEHYSIQKLIDCKPLKPSKLNRYYTVIQSVPELSMNQFQPSQQPQQARKPQPEEEGIGALILNVILALMYGILAVWAVFTTFLVAGSVFDQFLDGDLKFAIALVLAVGIPLLTALGENSQKQGREKVRGPLERVHRVFIGSAIISFMAAILFSLAMAGNVVGQLRNNPVWFLTQDARAYGPPPLEDFTRRYSIVLSDIIEQVATPLGLYEWKPYRADNSGQTSIADHFTA